MKYRYLIWICSDSKLVGPTILELIDRNLGPERVLIWDTGTRGGMSIYSMVNKSS